MGHLLLDEAGQAELPPSTRGKSALQTPRPGQDCNSLVRMQPTAVDAASSVLDSSLVVSRLLSLSPEVKGDHAASGEATCMGAYAEPWCEGQLLAELASGGLGGKKRARPSPAV